MDYSPSLLLPGQPRPRLVRASDVAPDRWLRKGLIANASVQRTHVSWSNRMIVATEAQSRFVRLLSWRGLLWYKDGSSLDLPILDKERRT